MCGIVGYVGNDVSKYKVQTMLEKISHRGPDDSGLFVKNGVGMGNNRLSVIDLSKNGHQPMFDSEKSLCIVYNGEIYNFQEIKRRLEKEFIFKSRSDTEVIIYAYKKWGVKCLNYLNGMFAFVIFDIKNGQLFGARDRLGEKPFKYFYDGKKFVFASEIKSILSVLNRKQVLDFSAINDYLTLQYVPAPKTGFKNIFKLPPASYFLYKNGKLNIYKYWNLDFSKKIELTESQWSDTLKEKIENSVKDRMVSDVPLGAFLSGGVDSSTITAFMVKNSSKQINTFSIGFDNSKFDETKYAEYVSKLCGTKHFSLKLDSKMIKEELPKIFDYFDEPIADNSLIPTFFLSRFARKKVTVALSGDGGDELFAGYDRYNIVAFEKYYKLLPKQLRNNVIKPSTKSLFCMFPNLMSLRTKTFACNFDSEFYKRYLHYRSFFSNQDKAKILSKTICKLDDTFLSNKEEYNHLLDNIDNALRIDISSYLPEDLLYKMDIASMSASLEVRSPLLDYNLMELMAQMPSKYKIKFFNKKYIFKKMLLDGNILPPGIVNRPKQGFVLPLDKWLRDDLKDYTITSLNSKKFREMGIFDNKKLDEYIANYYSGNVNYYNNIFSLISLSSWINKYF